jgi:alanyl-tRNA synthetase
MEWMSSKDIREKFLSFFENKDHKRINSSPLIPNDPQLMFTVAGMVPFKPIFWGKMEPTHTRITTCQKCLRTNDIENVGKTARHQTFFEMLGNFSFGDYFKEEAIEMAWEFLTEELKIPEEKLWVSVFKDDSEAYDVWKDKINFPENKIVKMGKEDNWWGPPGPSGPCGPDTEIFYDTGITDNCPNVENCTPECDCGRFVEIWNVVFTEFYSDEKGNLEPLSRKNIDTGAGLERLTAAIQGVYSNFDTDLFQKIIKEIEKSINVKYGEEEKEDISIKIIADHARAISFILAEGVLPSNEGRGYVLRRIIRRAVRHGNLLGMNNNFMRNIIKKVVSEMSGFYPELKEKEDFILKIVDSEEERFFETLERGLQKLEEIMKNSKDKKISGKVAFELYDTYGFPFDITKEIAEEKGFSVDQTLFDDLMEQQKDRARKSTGSKEYGAQNQAYEKIASQTKSTEFTGYLNNEEKDKLLYIVNGKEIVENAKKGETVELFFSKTPFYAEKGGQVADTGVIIKDGFKAEVYDVQVIKNDIISHKVKVLDGEVKAGEELNLQIDFERRNAIKRNHTATHLLHAALQKFVGNHIRQAGSYVEPTRLRFDFTHYEALSEEDISKIEKSVNEQIMKAIPVNTEVKSLEDAKNMNVMALFEEKYGNEVRVVSINDYSKELCGGTHVLNTGELGLFKIISETSVSAGMRRIEAVTGFSAFEYVKKLEKTNNKIKEFLEASDKNIFEKLENLTEKNKQLEKSLKEMEQKMASSDIDNFLKNADEIDGVKIVTGSFDGVDDEVLRNTSDTLLQKAGKSVVILFNKKDKVNFVVKVSKDATDKFHAGNIARSIAKYLGGGGGGRADFAQAGGKDTSKVQEVIQKIKEFI